MPKLSYPGGRKAAAQTSEQEEDLKSASIKKVDVDGDHTPVDDERQVQQVQDEASQAFQKQIDALRKSEQIQKDRNAELVREREEAIRRANERETEIHRLKKTTVESQAEAVSNALAAATAEAETAQHDIEKALELGDFKGQADAYRRLAKAERDIGKLEDGKVELDAAVKAASEAKVETVERAKDPLDAMNIPNTAKDYLRLHPELLTNQRKNAKIQALHYDIIDEGHEAYSKEYFDSMDIHLGYKEKPEAIEQEDEDPPERTRFMSAPVSREVPPDRNGDRPGRVTLSVAQKEAAKIAGITEKEYAEQVLELRKQKANGHYGGQP
jgi:hypothetical protein